MVNQEVDIILEKSTYFSGESKKIRCMNTWPLKDC